MELQDNEDPADLSALDTTRPAVARMYDYYLGGKDNFEVDRDAVDKVALAMPIRQLAWENRAFLRRAVRYMARQGISQFIDIGSGLPTVGNTHEIVQEINPDAHVVYVDHDPVVLTYGRVILAANDNTTVIQADMHRPTEVLDHPRLESFIDFIRPVGVMMVAMTHFLTDAERPEVMGYLYSRLASGSYLTATQGTLDGHSPDAVAQVEAVYRDTPTPIYFRDHATITRFFDGYDLVEPGLVTLDQWRPDHNDPAPQATNWMYGGVGHKP